MALTGSALAACGEPLADNAFRGDPLLTLEGFVVIGVGDEDDPDTDTVAELFGRTDELRMAVVWMSQSEVDTIDQGVLASSTFPARYKATIFSPPPEAAMRRDALAPYAAGMLLIYRDTDDDGRFNADVDLLVGGARQTLLLYTPFGAGDGVRGKGFHRVRVLPGDEQQICEDVSSVLSWPDAPSDNTLLTIDEDFRVSTLLDVDCDGSLEEWGDPLCPSQELLDEQCDFSDSDVSEDDWFCFVCGPEPPVDFGINEPMDPCESQYLACLESGAPPFQCDFILTECIGVRPFEYYGDDPCQLLIESCFDESCPDVVNECYVTVPAARDEFLSQCEGSPDCEFIWDDHVADCANGFFGCLMTDQQPYLTCASSYIECLPLP